MSAPLIAKKSEHSTINISSLLNFLKSSFNILNKNGVTATGISNQ